MSSHSEWTSSGEWSEEREKEEECKECLTRDWGRGLGLIDEMHEKSREGKMHVVLSLLNKMVSQHLHDYCLPKDLSLFNHYLSTL